MATADDIVPVEPQRANLQNSPITAEEPQAVSGPAAPGTTAVCLWNGQQFGPGARVCGAGRVLVCTHAGTWAPTGEHC